ncbi:MAG: carboxypeptidase regulatory-like domain-containing protein [Candidatus Eisenbacteria bacterium]
MFPKRWLLPVLLLSLGLLPPARTHAGAIEGIVWMNRGAQIASAKKPDATAQARAQRGVTDAVVWIEKIPEKVELNLSGQGRHWFWQRSKPEAVSSIVQVNQNFRPRVTAVPARTRVEIRNGDRVYHNTFSVSAARRFDLGIHPPGRRDTLQFARGGVIKLYSALYPEMLGFVVVTPNHAYARPDSLGRFALPKLPPGRYTVRAWHPQRGELKRQIEVPRGGEVMVKLRF